MRPAGRLGRLGPLHSQVVSTERWGQMREFPPQGPGQGGEGILTLGSVAGTPWRGLWEPQLLEDSSSLPSGQSAPPSLVSLLGNPGGDDEGHCLPSFVESPRGETEVPLVWETSIP